MVVDQENARKGRNRPKAGSRSKSKPGLPVLVIGADVLARPARVRSGHPRDRSGSAGGYGSSQCQSNGEPQDTRTRFRDSHPLRNVADHATSFDLASGTPLLWNEQRAPLRLRSGEHAFASLSRDD